MLVGYAIPGFVLGVALLVVFGGQLQWFPLRGLTSSNWDELSWGARIVDYLWHIALPVTAMVVGSFAVTTMLTKNSFLEEIRKQYVLTARAKGLAERQVLWKHVFRNALMPIITGFPAAFLGAFFTGSLLIETLFSLDGLGLLSYESVIRRDYPVVLGTLVPVHADRPGDQADQRPLLRLGGPACQIRLKPPHRPRAGELGSARGGAAPVVGPHLSPGRRAWLRFKRNRLGFWSLVLFGTLVVLSLFAEVISNDRPLIVRYNGQIYFPMLDDYSEKTFGGDFETATDYLDPFIREQLSKGGNWAVYPPNPYGSKTLNYFAKEPNPSRPTRDNLLRHR